MASIGIRYQLLNAHLTAPFNSPNLSVNLQTEFLFPLALSSNCSSGKPRRRLGEFLARAAVLILAVFTAPINRLTRCARAHPAPWSCFLYPSRRPSPPHAAANPNPQQQSTPVAQDGRTPSPVARRGRRSRDQVAVSLSRSPSPSPSPSPALPLYSLVSVHCSSALLCTIDVCCLLICSSFKYSLLIHSTTPSPSLVFFRKWKPVQGQGVLPLCWFNTNCRLKLEHAEDLVFVHQNLRLLSRKSEEYSSGPTRIWDVRGDSHEVLEGGANFL